MSPFRIGMIVSIFNTTMVMEIPAMLRAREAVADADVNVAASIVGGYYRFDVLGLALNRRPLEPLAEGRAPDEPRRGRSDRELFVGGE